jgi:hypothetical protein
MGKISAEERSEELEEKVQDLNQSLSELTAKKSKVEE